MSTAIDVDVYDSEGLLKFVCVSLVDSLFENRRAAVAKLPRAWSEAALSRFLSHPLRSRASSEPDPGDSSSTGGTARSSSRAVQSVSSNPVLRDRLLQFQEAIHVEAARRKELRDLRTVSLVALASRLLEDHELEPQARAAWFDELAKDSGTSPVVALAAGHSLIANLSPVDARADLPGYASDRQAVLKGLQSGEPTHGTGKVDQVIESLVRVGSLPPTTFAVEAMSLLARIGPPASGPIAGAATGGSVGFKLLQTLTFMLERQETQPGLHLTSSVWPVLRAAFTAKHEIEPNRTRAVLTEATLRMLRSNAPSNVKARCAEFLSARVRDTTRPDRERVYAAWGLADLGVADVESLSEQLMTDGDVDRELIDLAVEALGIAESERSKSPEERTPGQRGLIDRKDLLSLASRATYIIDSAPPVGRQEVLKAYGDEIPESVRTATSYLVQVCLGALDGVAVRRASQCLRTAGLGNLAARSMLQLFDGLDYEPAFMRVNAAFSLSHLGACTREVTETLESWVRSSLGAALNDPLDKSSAAVLHAVLWAIGDLQLVSRVEQRREPWCLSNDVHDLVRSAVVQCDLHQDVRSASAYVLIGYGDERVEQLVASDDPDVVARVARWKPFLRPGTPTACRLVDAGRSVPPTPDRRSGRVVSAGPLDQ